MKNSVLISLLSRIALLVVMFLSACSSGGKQKDAGQVYFETTKPAIDTALVLETLSPKIGKLTYLQTLDVAQNLLFELPDELAGLHYLQGFYANGNRLTVFPEQHRPFCKPDCCNSY